MSEEVKILHRGEWMRQRIKDNGITLEEMADKLNIGVATIYRWMAQAELTNDKMKRIADLLKVDLRDHLLGFDETYEMTGGAPISFKKQYYELLEENADLLRKIMKYADLYGPLPGQKSGLG